MDSYRLVAALIAFSARFRRNPRPKGQGVVTNRACQAEDHSKITVRVTLVIYPLKREKRPHSDDFAFFLLVDREAPESLVWQLEQLQSVFKRRIRTPDDYELVKLPRKGRRPTWTWRMGRDLYEDWELRTKGAIYKGDDLAIRRLRLSFARMPGFHGIREQAKELRKVFFYAWKRVRRDEPQMPALPGFLGRRRELERVSVREL